MIFFVSTEIVCIPTGKSTEINEFQYIVSRPGLGSDPPIGSDRGSGHDISGAEQTLVDGSH